MKPARPLLAKTLFEKGANHDAGAELSRVIDEYKRAIAELPEGLTAAELSDYTSLATAHELIGDGAEMKASYERLVAKAKPSDDVADRLALAWAFFKLHRSDDAEREIDLVLRSWPNHPEAISIRAHFAEAAGKREEASEAFRKAFAIDRSLEMARDGIKRMRLQEKK